MWIVRDTPGTVGTLDGYVYRWETAGQAVAVLPQHARDLLDLPGYSAAEDQPAEPVTLPAVVELEERADTLVRPKPVKDTTDLSSRKVRASKPPKAEALPDTLVRPETVDEVTDLSKAKVKKPDLPDPEPLPDTLVVPETEDEVTDLSHVEVKEPRLPKVKPLPDTTVAPDAQPEPVVKVSLSDLWSAGDLERLAAEGGLDPYLKGR